MSTPGQASRADIFLDVQTKRMGKIKGEVTTEGHVDEIALCGWAWGAQAGDSVGYAARTAKRQYGPVVVTKSLDAASVPLLNVLATNDEVKQATLSMRKAGGAAVDYYTLKLGGARITDIGYGVDDQGSSVERVSFSFTRFDVEYQGQDADGTGRAGIAFSDEVIPSDD